MSTHFIDLCVKLEKNNDKIGNMKMDVTQTGDDFIYGYKLKPGISDVKGGVKVLKDLNYPDEIVANTKKFLDTEF
jgi:DNA mismatch repair ATPase MutS